MGLIAFVPRLSFLRNMCWHYLRTLSSLITINHLSDYRYFLKWLISLIIFRMTVSKDLFIRMDFNQSTTSVIQVVLWPPPPPLRLLLLRPHHASHWSVTILQCEPIRWVGAGYTSLLFKHSVPHAFFLLLLQICSAESCLLYCILINSRCWL